MMDELEALKRFIAEGGKCWVCGDTGIAGQTLQYPDGEPCDCLPEYSAQYILEHWVEKKASIPAEEDVLDWDF